MGDTAGAIIAGAVMLNCTMLVVVALLWYLGARGRGLADRSPSASACERTLAGQEQLRAELAEVATRVRAIQRLLEDVAE